MVLPVRAHVAVLCACDLLTYLQRYHCRDPDRASQCALDVHCAQHIAFFFACW
jgi:hypothetical protein